MHNSSHILDQCHCDGCTAMSGCQVLRQRRQCKALALKLFPFSLKAYTSPLISPFSFLPPTLISFSSPLPQPSTFLFSKLLHAPQTLGVVGFGARSPKRTPPSFLEVKFLPFILFSLVFRLFAYFFVGPEFVHHIRVVYLYLWSILVMV